jgi:UDPglucose 6-dehydrogenase
MNEIANLCENVGADVSQVRRGIGTDSRIGTSFLFPGVGYGGSCFPKDVRALIKTGNTFGTKMSVIEAVDLANDKQKIRMATKVVEHFTSGEQNIQKDCLKGKVFALWGLAFKPKTDDMREAPSLTIIKELTERGASIRAYDPEAMDVAKKMLQNQDTNIVFVDSAYEALEQADALVIVTEWNEFRRPNFNKMTQTLKSPIIFDGRNLFEPSKMARLGFTYYSIGRQVSGS